MRRDSQGGSAAIKHIGLILLLFGLSVVIRAPHLNRPLSDGHEWLTAHTMISLQNLEARGPLRHHFLPLQTFPLRADRFVYDSTMRMQTSDGDGYYTSFPPFGLMAPYLVLAVLGTGVSVLALQFFNLAVHLATTLTLYITFCRVLSPGNTSGGALAGAAAFLFFAPNLWYFSNVYSWDTFWHFLYVTAILGAIRLAEGIAASEPTTRWLVLLALATFLFTYSEWQGLLFAACFTVWAISGRRRSGDYVRAAIVVPASALLAVALTFVQFSSLVGSWPYLDKLACTAAGRSQSSTFFWQRIIRNYDVGFGYLLWPMVVMLVVWWIWHRPGSGRVSLHRRESLFVYLSVAPVVIHHFLFTQWTAIHDFSIVKASVFLAGLLGWTFQRVLDSRRMPRAAVLALGLALAYAAYLSISVYQHSYAYSPAPTRFSDLGLAIRAAVDDSEVVFAVSEKRIVPQVIYYAGRDIQSVDGVTEAVRWLATHDRGSGRLFYVDRQYRLLDEVPITLR